MKFNRKMLLGLASLALWGASVAHAAVVGQLACASNTANITANISFYDLGLSNTLNIGSQSSGAGAGKVTFNPLEIHTAVVNFSQFFQHLASGGTFSSCTLVTRTNGETVEYTFTLVGITSLDAIARSPHTEGDMPASYLDVKLNFGSVQVKTATGGDNGGLEGGWNVVKNRSN
jgi:type VI protein secretion system component Hcp